MSRLTFGEVRFSTINAKMGHFIVKCQKTISGFKTIDLIIIVTTRQADEFRLRFREYDAQSVMVHQQCPYVY